MYTYIKLYNPRVKTPLAISVRIFCSVRHGIGFLPLVTITNGFIKRGEEESTTKEGNYRIKLLREIDGTDIRQEYFDELN